MSCLRILLHLHAFSIANMIFSWHIESALCEGWRNCSVPADDPWPEGKAAFSPVGFGQKQHYCLATGLSQNKINSLCIYCTYLSQLNSCHWGALNLGYVIMVVNVSLCKHFINTKPGALCNVESYCVCLYLFPFEYVNYDFKVIGVFHVLLSVCNFFSYFLLSLFALSYFIILSSRLSLSLPWARSYMSFVV